MKFKEFQKCVAGSKEFYTLEKRLLPIAEEIVELLNTKNLSMKEVTQVLKYLSGKMNDMRIVAYRDFDGKMF